MSNRLFNLKFSFAFGFDFSRDFINASFNSFSFSSNFLYSGSEFNGFRTEKLTFFFNTESSFPTVCFFIVMCDPSDYVSLLSITNSYLK